MRSRSMTPPPDDGHLPAPAPYWAAPLADPAEAEARRAHLDLPHMAPLAAYAAGLRKTYGHVPDADPADGGIEAHLLLLLETPGPRVGRTNFVSADNASGTGRNLRRYMLEAGIARTDRVIWNVVPWVVHAGGPNRALRTPEIREGLTLLPDFLALLPRLHVAVLAGRIAGLARPVLEQARPGLTLVPMPHPSPTIVCTSPDIPRRIQSALAEAAKLLPPPPARPDRRADR